MVTAEASSKIAGYIFQFQRALYRLFSSEEASTLVGVETDDDVVEVGFDSSGDIQIVFEQDKHSVQEAGHPYQDSSKNLWHTLHIWLDSMEVNRKKYKRICYCLVTNKNVPAHTFAKKLGMAKSKDQIDECIAEIRSRATNSTSGESTTIRAVSAFPDDLISFLIENLRVMDDYATSSGSSPKGATIQLFQLPPELHEKGDKIYEGLLGMMINDCQDAWLKRDVAWFDKSKFTRRLHEEISAYRFERYIERPLVNTAYQDYLKDNPDDHVFLRQMKRIGLPDDICDRALSHYWGFYAEKIRLQKEGDVLPNAWVSRDQQLHERWQVIGDSVAAEIVEVQDEEKTSRKIYSRTIDGSYLAKLGMHDTSYPYFTSGNYHELANKPDYAQFIFWHSSFIPKVDKDEQ